MKNDQEKLFPFSGSCAKVIEKTKYFSEQTIFVRNIAKFYKKNSNKKFYFFSMQHNLC